MAIHHWKTKSNSSLFERMRQKATERGETKVLTLTESIKAHLNKILNARPGEAPSAIDLGIIDLNDASSSRIEMNTLIASAIKKCIILYEPRVHSVTVAPIEPKFDILTLSFRVEAHVNLDLGFEKLEFDVNLDHTRRYKLDTA